MKDFFKKLTKTQNDVDDLDAGYDSEYYQGAYDRVDRYDDRRDDRYEPFRHIQMNSLNCYPY